MTEDGQVVNIQNGQVKLDEDFTPQIGRCDSISYDKNRL